MNKNLYLVTMPHLKGTTLPVYYYTFANSEEEAIHKVTMKYGEFSKDIKVRQVQQNEINQLVIGTNFL